jgi:hypothetical protein
LARKSVKIQKGGTTIWRKQSEVKRIGTCRATKGARGIEREKVESKSAQKAYRQGAADEKKGNKKCLNKERQSARGAQEVL